MFKQNKEYSKFVYLMGGLEGGIESSDEQGGEKAQESAADAPKSEAQKAKDKAAGMVESGQNRAEELGTKTKIDASKITSYPEQAKGSEHHKKGVAVLLPQLKALIKKRQGRDVRHKDVFGGQIDEHSVQLLIDESQDPPYRVFRDPKKSAKKETKQGGTDMPPEKVKKVSKGYPEIKPPSAQKIKEGKEMYKRIENKKMKNEDSVTFYDAKDFEYVLLIDNEKPRLFKSPKPVPA